MGSIVCPPDGSSLHQKAAGSRSSPKVAAKRLPTVARLAWQTDRRREDANRDATPAGERVDRRHADEREEGENSGEHRTACDRAPGKAKDQGREAGQQNKCGRDDETDEDPR